MVSRPGRRTFHRHDGFGVVNMEMPDNSYQMEHEEIEKLFRSLDRNKDGRIDVNELAEGLKHIHGSRYKAGQAQVS